MSETFTLLYTWTPFLLTGFMWNVLVTLLAVVIGTVVGAGLAAMRVKQTGLASRVGDVLSRIFRNVPTLAFLFFAAMAIPRELTVWGVGIAFPLWLKAALGMSASVIGFTAESLLVAYQNLRRKDYAASLLFLPTWGSSVMISFIASSTASLVGVSELVGRGNAIIAATGTDALFPVYIYCASFFVVACLAWMALMKRLRHSETIRALPQHIDTKWSLSAPAPTAP
ncbi:polar amino acid ABC transporter permease [Rhodoferax sp. AJA081-3]|uniref:polar amino acid ABC transporter permease n=1 Tax=Rhodoferax sp. AJA081-3 TaxID=2752316 RepID=UPI001ADF2255|nr:polar amino acid ABC transporter permease [Rhodoferax sp. AJA081-3]QTN27623.1 polar amino acid ABC transporter permease [Rhodoferax sp. AJA081-3]